MNESEFRRKADLHKLPAYPLSVGEWLAYSTCEANRHLLRSERFLPCPFPRAEEDRRSSSDCLPRSATEGGSPVPAERTTGGPRERLLSDYGAYLTA